MPRPKKYPWRKHFTKNWRTDPFVRSLDLEARMVYFELLDICWDEGGLRSEWLETGRYLAGEIRISRRKFVSIWPSIRVKFVESSPGFWTNLKLELIRSSPDKPRENDDKPASSIDPDANPGTQKDPIEEEEEEEGEEDLPRVPRCDAAKVAAAWKDETRRFASGTLSGVTECCEQGAALEIPPWDPNEYASKAIREFVKWVSECPPKRRPQLAPHKFVEHFARIQERVSGGGAKASSVMAKLTKASLAQRGDS